MWSKFSAITFSFSALFLVASAQTLPPSDVTNLIAEPGDQSITLTWDASEDDGFVTGYRVYYGTSPVVEADDSYEDEFNTNSSESTYTLNNLLNGVTYYFSVTATDDDQMESVNYSNEASATPQAPVTGDTEGPKVISAEHTAINEITVVMSESITPTEASSFLLSQRDTFAEVEIEDILFNSENLILTIPVGALEPGDIYEFTATSAVEDLAGNPVSSGITDTVTFTGQSTFEVAVEEPILEEPAVVEEPIVVVTEPESIEEPEPIETIIDEDFGDLESLLNEIEEEEAPSFSSAPDNTAPLEAQDLQADTSQMENTEQVQLSWTPSLDLDNDVADQVLYTRVGLGSWDEGYSLGADTTQTTIEVEPNQNYQIRLVTVDDSGNTSDGAVFSFSTNLAQSGPGTVIALSAALILGVMMLLSRRRA